jgi:hypothetical protein
MGPASMICFGIGVMVCHSLEDPKPVPPPASTYCQIHKPLQWAPGDTRKTKEQIDDRNRVWKGLCRPQAPAPTS